MKKFVFMLLAAGFVTLLPYAAGAASSEHPAGDCRECHKLEKKDAEAVIKKLNPQLTVLEVKESPIKSLWQIDVDAGEGKRGPIFLDFSKKNLVVIQQIIPVESIGKPAPQRKIDFSKLPLQNAIVVGPKNAKKKIAVFTDPDCPYCRKLHDEMKKLLEKRKDTAFYVFLRPLPMHKDAFKKSESIICDKAKSVALLDDAMAGKVLPDPSCSTAKEQVEKNNELADSLEFRGTPTMVRGDGMVNPGYLPAEQLSTWIDGK